MKFEISKSFKGTLTAQDFLNSEGTLFFTILKQEIASGGFLFQLMGEEFIFALSFQNQGLVLQRNDVVSILTLDEFTNDIPLGIFVTWNFDKLGLNCHQGVEKKTAEVPTTPSAPPASLITWARKENLIPKTEFESEEEFRQKICSCLQSIQSKIDESGGALSQFWDYKYGDNGKIIERNPKKEIGVQPIIQCLLSDQMLMSSIELVPEYVTGKGNLDFMFIGNIKGKGLFKICAEFKNAHSEDLEHGLLGQLPTYMENKNSKYGFYCVLNYKGEWFDKPDFENDTKIYLQLSKQQISSNDPKQKNIRLMIYNLGKQKTASKK